MKRITPILSLATLFLVASCKPQTPKNPQPELFVGNEIPLFAATHTLVNAMTSKIRRGGVVFAQKTEDGRFKLITECNVRTEYTWEETPIRREERSWDTWASADAELRGFASASLRAEFSSGKGVAFNFATPGFWRQEGFDLVKTDACADVTHYASEITTGAYVQHTYTGSRGDVKVCVPGDTASICGGAGGGKQAQQKNSAGDFTICNAAGQSVDDYKRHCEAPLLVRFAEVKEHVTPDCKDPDSYSTCVVYCSANPTTPTCVDFDRRRRDDKDSTDTPKPSPGTGGPSEEALAAAGGRGPAIVESFSVPSGYPQIGEVKRGSGSTMQLVSALPSGLRIVKATGHNSCTGLGLTDAPSENLAFLGDQWLRAVGPKGEDLEPFKSELNCMVIDQFWGQEKDWIAAGVVSDMLYVSMASIYGFRYLAALGYDGQWGTIPRTSTPTQQTTFVSSGFTDSSQFGAGTYRMVVTKSTPADTEVGSFEFKCGDDVLARYGRYEMQVQGMAFEFTLNSEKTCQWTFGGSSDGIYLATIGFLQKGSSKQVDPDKFLSAWATNLDYLEDQRYLRESCKKDTTCLEYRYLKRGDKEGPWTEVARPDSSSRSIVFGFDVDRVPDIDELIMARWPSASGVDVAGLDYRNDAFIYAFDNWDAPITLEYGVPDGQGVIVSTTYLEGDLSNNVKSDNSKM